MPGVSAASETEPSTKAKMATSKAEGNGVVRADAGSDVAVKGKKKKSEGKGKEVQGKEGKGKEGKGKEGKRKREEEGKGTATNGEIKEVSVKKKTKKAVDGSRAESPSSNGVKKKISEGGEAEDDEDLGARPKKKIAKKPKGEQLDEEERSSEGEDARKASGSSASSSDDCAGGEEEEEEEEAEGERQKEDPFRLERFRIRPAVQAVLRQKGITKLFPIQAETFDMVLDGSDLIARARTGQGKTLAFVLPIVERLKTLQESTAAAGARRAGAKLPSVIVLAPTRELAKQVAGDFETIGRAVGLSVVCVYGGAQMGPQERALFRGVDVVVGTPGRVKDLLQRGSLKLREVRFRVLDEADEMLDMGFVDDVETILQSVEDPSKVQTLLFSATVPEWVNKISDRFFRKERRVVDLVGGEEVKASPTVRHLLLPCHMHANKFQLIADVIATYSQGGKVIVFVETKSAASEYAQGLAHLGARALHGDVVQQQREVTLKAFRSGQFQVLVATDVAARGLDISDVQLVLQTEVPRSAETYIHRSGRTGRAGNKGVAVVLADGRAGRRVQAIERAAGVKLERIAAPQPADLVKASCASAATKVASVSDSVVPLFLDAASDLVQASNLPPVHALAKALACLAGHSELKARSLLTSQPDTVTLLFRTSLPFYTPLYVQRYLSQHLSQDQVQAVRNITLTADGCGAVFDIPSSLLDACLLASQQEGKGEVQLEVAKQLPELKGGTLGATNLGDRPFHSGSGGAHRGGWGGGRGGGWGRPNGGRGARPYGGGGGAGGSRGRGGGGWRSHGR